MVLNNYKPSKCAWPQTALFWTSLKPKRIQYLHTLLLNRSINHGKNFTNFLFEIITRHAKWYRFKREPDTWRNSSSSIIYRDKASLHVSGLSISWFSGHSGHITSQKVRRWHMKVTRWTSILGMPDASSLCLHTELPIGTLYSQLARFRTIIWNISTPSLGWGHVWPFVRYDTRTPVISIYNWHLGNADFLIGNADKVNTTHTPIQNRY